MQRRLVLRLTFGANIPYVRKEGFRTPELSAPFQLIQGLSGDELGEKSLDGLMVRPRRLELPRACAHNDLNVARLPIPPRPHAG